MLLKKKKWRTLLGHSVLHSRCFSLSNDRVYQKIDDYQLSLRAITSFSGIKFTLFVFGLLLFCSYLTAIFLPLGLKKAFIINIFSALSGAIFISSLLILNAIYLPYEVFIYSNYLTVLLTLFFIGTFIIILSFLFIKGKFDYGTEREIDRVVKAMLLVKNIALTTLSISRSVP